MPPLPIKQYGEPVLKEVARLIDAITPEHRRLAQDMAETMYANNGIGLAANQVGVLDRMIVVDIAWARTEEGEKPEKNPVAMINPEIIEESKEDDAMEEGCLSIPGILGEVWRPDRIKVRYMTLEGQVVEQECKGLLGRCIQHEVDHLNGVLFIDRMGTLKRKLLARSLKQILKSRETEPQQA